MPSPERAVKQARFQLPVADAWALFARARSVRFAGVTDEGTPVLRTFNAVVVDERLCFHGADDGEKLGLLGRPVVASCEEIVAQVASYWMHPENACPASTYYVSAFAEGRIVRIDDPARKALVLTRLMERFQPEGGYVPITHDDTRYRKMVEQLLVVELVPTRVYAKQKLGQHHGASRIERVLDGLWTRGEPGDVAAIRTIRDAHPARPTPAFLRGPEGTELCVAPDARDAEAVARLLAGQYWTEGFTHARMAQAQRGSTAWVVARDLERGEVVASARAVSDHARFGYVLDVIVDPAWRGRGLGVAVTRTLLAHPAVRSLLSIGLRTRDAHGLYERFGFRSSESDPRAMTLTRTEDARGSPL